MLKNAKGGFIAKWKPVFCSNNSKMSALNQLFSKYFIIFVDVKHVALSGKELEALVNEFAYVTDEKAKKTSHPKEIIFENF